MEIPDYPEERPIDLGDKGYLDALFNRLQPRVSEFTFANLYLFRIVHQYRLTKVGDSLVILARGYGGDRYFLLPPAEGVEKTLSRLLGDGLTLYGADTVFVDRYLRRKEFEIFTDRDNYDYLYSKSDMAELPGNRFHKKKNKINYFTSRHEYKIEPYEKRHLQGCLDLLGVWLRAHEEMEGGNSGALETEAAAEALNMAVPLGLEGVVAIVEGQVKAFAIGEMLNRDTSVCHFEKAEPFLDGIYQLIDREFNRLLFSNCIYVNREQDLGIMNLRKSKLSYHPIELIEKYRVKLIPHSE